ncbi:MAG: branched-chain amino acid ABC transporter permease [Pseudomonadota bacterium]|nr:branched-chain amino acid ABC transporter permease [Pseudomonadota bacterium]
MDMLLSSPSFAFIQVLNSISLGMNLFIIAAGLSLIFGVLRVINFAHGVFYMFGAYIMYSVTKEFHMNFFWGVIAAAIGLAVIAVLIERGLFQWLYDKEHLMQLLLTFAIVLIMGDLAKIIWGTDQLSVSYPESLSGATNLGFTFYPSYRLMLCIVGPLIFLGLWFLIEKTRWGRLTRAATQDMEMLAALGVNVPVIYVTIFLIGSALAGVGGSLAAPINSPTPGMDATIIVECFVIVIIGD